MGRDGYFVCKTCKERIYLGYAGYSRWLDCVKDIDEYHNLPDKNKEMRINKNIEKCLTDHKGHEFLLTSSEWTYEDGCDLKMDGYTPYVLVEGYSSYKEIDMDEELK